LGKVVRSGPSRIPLRHGLGSLGEMDRERIEDKAGHHLAIQMATTDPIYPLS
jgi:hypothetical protein